MKWCDNPTTKSTVGKRVQWVRGASQPGSRTFIIIARKLRLFKSDRVSSLFNWIFYEVINCYHL